MANPASQGHLETRIYWNSLVQLTGHCHSFINPPSILSISARKSVGEIHCDLLLRDPAVSFVKL